MVFALIWFYAGGRKHYTGPRNLIHDKKVEEVAATGDELVDSGKN